MGDFGSKMDDIMDRVGDGPLVGSVVVDQAYAKYQHEDLSLRHPAGGKAQYLHDPLYAGHTGYLNDLSKRVLEGGANQAMADSMEDVAKGVYQQAPLEFGDLKASPHPTVTSDGSMVYDRPAMVHRLSDEEIEIKRDLRDLGLGNL